MGVDSKLDDMKETKISSSIPVRMSAAEIAKPKRGVSFVASKKLFFFLS